MPDDRRPWEVMQALLARSDVPALERYLQRLPSSETVRAVFQLRPEEQSRRSGPVRFSVCEAYHDWRKSICRGSASGAKWQRQLLA
jgi:hypothetical protein